MYNSYFGLSGHPFKLTPDTSFFFEEGQRKAILDALVYALRNGDGIVKLIGEVGSGKTFLSRVLVKALPNHFEFIFLLNPNMPPENVLAAIARELRISLPHPTDKLHVLHGIQAHLMSLHANNRQVVVIIDEAQSMPPETLEEIRLLSNLETESHKLLQIVLIGQPELDQHLNRHDIRQIKERITHSLYLPSLNQGEIYRYIDYRLRCAGYHGAPLFSKSSAKLIALNSRGLLRRINILADKALLVAFSKNSRFVGLCDAFKSIVDSTGFRSGLGGVSKAVVIPGILGLCIALTLGKWDIADFTGRLLLDTTGVPQVHQLRGQRSMVRIAEPVESVETDSHHNLLQSRIADTQTWLGQSTQLGYSIQLLQTFSEQRMPLEKFFRDSVPASLIAKTYVFPTQVNGKKLWSVFFDRFESYQQAAATLKTLDTQLKRNQPFVVSMADIKGLFQESGS